MEIDNPNHNSKRPNYEKYFLNKHPYLKKQKVYGGDIWCSGDTNINPIFLTNKNFDLNEVLFPYGYQIKIHNKRCPKGVETWDLQNRKQTIKKLRWLVVPKLTRLSKYLSSPDAYMYATKLFKCRNCINCKHFEEYGKLIEKLTNFKYVYENTFKNQSFQQYVRNKVQKCIPFMPYVVKSLTAEFLYLDLWLVNDIVHKPKPKYIGGSSGFLGGDTNIIMTLFHFTLISYIINFIYYSIISPLINFVFFKTPITFLKVVLISSEIIITETIVFLFSSSVRVFYFALFKLYWFLTLKSFRRACYYYITPFIVYALYWRRQLINSERRIRAVVDLTIFYNLFFHLVFIWLLQHDTKWRHCIRYLYPTITLFNILWVYVFTLPNVLNHLIRKASYEFNWYIPVFLTCLIWLIRNRSFMAPSFPFFFSPSSAKKPPKLIIKSVRGSCPSTKSIFPFVFKVDGYDDYYILPEVKGDLDPQEDRIHWTFKEMEKIFGPQGSIYEDRHTHYFLSSNMEVVLPLKIGGTKINRLFSTTEGTNSQSYPINESRDYLRLIKDYKRKVERYLPGHLNGETFHWTGNNFTDERVLVSNSRYGMPEFEFEHYDPNQMLRTMSRVYAPMLENSRLTHPKKFFRKWKLVFLVDLDLLKIHVSKKEEPCLNKYLGTPSLILRTTWSLIPIKLPLFPTLSQKWNIFHSLR